MLVCALKTIFPLQLSRELMVSWGVRDVGLTCRKTEAKQVQGPGLHRYWRGSKHTYSLRLPVLKETAVNRCRNKNKECLD